MNLAAQHPVNCLNSQSDRIVQQKIEILHRVKRQKVSKGNSKSSCVQEVTKKYTLHGAFLGTFIGAGTGIAACLKVPNIGDIKGKVAGFFVGLLSGSLVGLTGGAGVGAATGVYYSWGSCDSKGNFDHDNAREDAEATKAVHDVYQIAKEFIKKPKKTN